MESISKLRLQIVKELSKFERNTSFYNEDYLGTEQQIENETNILSELLECIDENVVEIRNGEDIVEWYRRMLKETRVLMLS